MRSSLRLATLSAAFAVLGFGSLGQAQVTSVTVTTSSITRQLANGSYYPSHIVDGTYQGIGQKDCTDDSEIVFPVIIAGLPDDTVTFEIWAGTGDCTQTGATNNASTATCWPVAVNQVPQSVMSIPLRVTDIVSQLGIAPPNQSYAAASTGVCTGTATTLGEASVNVFFMFFPTGSSTPSVSSAAYPLKVKLSGPLACTNVTAASGDGLLIVDFNPPPGETDIQGYDLFAQPSGSGGDASAVATCSSTIDASSAATACADGGTSNLMCVQVNGTTNGAGTIAGLTNGVSYAVAVAAFDQFGNTGALSSVACSTPQPIDDFWKVYSQNGAGAGSCALDVVGTQGSPAAVAVVVTVFVLRRRKKAESLSCSKSS
jgi:hypothetical protein